MKKKISLLIIIIVLIIIFYWQTVIKETMLISLKQDIELCEIKKDELWFNSGKFWMICNDRPFYAEFENGKIRYDMNGWSFLKEQPDVFKDLNDNKCDFLYSKDNKLFFFCEKGVAKIYDFNINNFKLENVINEELINIIFEDIKKIYDCSPYDSFRFVSDGTDFLTIKLDCKGYDTVLNFNLEKISYSLPIIMDEGLSNEEKAKLSFQLLGVCRLDNIDNISQEEILLSVFCGTSKENFLISYNLFTGIAKFAFSIKEFEKSYPLFKRRILPFLDSDEELEYLTTREYISYKFSFYKHDKKILVSEQVKDSFIISEFFLKNEGFNGDKYQ